MHRRMVSSSGGVSEPATTPAEFSATSRDTAPDLTTRTARRSPLARLPTTAGTGELRMVSTTKMAQLSGWPEEEPLPDDAPPPKLPPEPLDEPPEYDRDLLEPDMSLPFNRRLRIGKTADDARAELVAERSHRASTPALLPGSKNRFDLALSRRGRLAARLPAIDRVRVHS